MSRYFSVYMKNIAEKKDSKIILALDFDPKISNHEMVKRAVSLIDMLDDYIIGIKMNMHILLPLSRDDIRNIIKIAKDHEIATIADIKLNDIPDTNQAAIYNLASMDFDATIINPFIGFQALSQTVDYARLEDMGIITLVFMSHRGAENTYGLKVDSKRLYDIFLEWSLTLNVDGIVVGATYPDIIKHCYDIAKDEIPIYSPGIVTQGGDPSIAIKNGVEYLIIGRRIINSDDPSEAIRKIRSVF